MRQFSYKMNRPELRSVELLKSVSESAGVEIIQLSQNEIHLRFKGESKRWYEIESQVIFDEEYLEETVEWITNTKAARWKSDLINDTEFSVKLCVHPNDKNLPIGDQIVSIVLALINDIQTAMEIPMLAKFLICPRTTLENIVIFQEMMVVTKDMIDDGDWQGEFHNLQVMLEQQEDIVMGAMEEDDVHIPYEHEWIEGFDFSNFEEELEELRIEEKEKREQEIVRHWERMNDNLHDNQS